MALIPLSSQPDADNVIEQTKKEAQKHASHQVAEDVSSDHHSSADEDSEGHVTDDMPEQPKALTPSAIMTLKSQEGNDSVAQDVMGRKGQYGRFAESWFSRKGWTSERRRAQGMGADDVRKSDGILDRQQDGRDKLKNKIEQDGKNLPEVPGQPPARASQPGASQGSDVTSTLLPKLLRTTKMLFASQNFFFSYDYDITRRVEEQTTQAPNVPLYRSVDPLVGQFHKSCNGLTDINVDLVLLESAFGSALCRKW